MVILVPPELLQKSPSQEDGLDVATELELRSLGAGLVQGAGVLLRLPQLTIVSAAVVFQRFYFRKSFADFDVRIAATAALVLACKLEESHRKLQEVIVCCHHLQMRSLQEEDDAPTYAGRPTPILDPKCHEHIKTKEDVVKAERHILQELGFDMIILQLDHPHKYLLQYIKALNCVELAQMAWNYLNDSLRTTLCCAYQPQQIALASIYLAARCSGTKLPSRPPWWDIFGIKAKDLRDIAEVIAAVYRRPLPEYIHIPRKKRVVDHRQETPATPLVETTPAPTKSPSDEEGGALGSATGLSEADGAVGLSRQDSLDPGRLAEMIAERGAEPAPMPPPSSLPLAAPVRQVTDALRRADEDRRGEKEKERERDRDNDQERNNDKDMGRKKDGDKRKGRDNNRYRGSSSSCSSYDSRVRRSPSRSSPQRKGKTKSSKLARGRDRARGPSPSSSRSRSQRPTRKRDARTVRVPEQRQVLLLA